MEEEIDLRPYIKALMRNWIWILGTAIVLAVLAFVLSSLAPPTYQATALVAAVEPRDVVQFDSRIRETETEQPLDAFPQLAVSDQILKEVLAENDVPDVEDVKTLRQQLSAETGSDDTLILLTVEAGDPGQAASIVNSWAAIFVDWANEVYGHSNQNQVLLFEALLEESRLALEEAESAVVAFQGENQQLLATNALTAISETQAELLQTKYKLEMLQQDAMSLREQMNGAPSSDPVVFADQLVALLLQIQTFEPSYSAETVGTPIQLQLDSTAPLTSQSYAEQRAFLDNLLENMETRLAQIDDTLTALEPELLALQQEMQSAETEYNRLVREQSVAEETYTALARKVEEERITSADTISGIRLASEAATPTEPESQRRLIITAVAFIAGLMISSLAVVMALWWREANGQEDA